MQNGEAVKLYNSANVYLLFNKETYEVSEYIFYKKIFYVVQDVMLSYMICQMKI